MWARAGGHDSKLPGMITMHDVRRRAAQQQLGIGTGFLQELTSLSYRYTTKRWILCNRQKQILLHIGILFLNKNCTVSALDCSGGRYPPGSHPWPGNRSRYPLNQACLDARSWWGIKLVIGGFPSLSGQTSNARWRRSQ
jgi:hypothetical protein